MASLADTLGTKPAELEKVQKGAYPGPGMKFKDIPGIWTPEEVIAYLLAKSPSMDPASDLIPWTVIASGDRDPAAVTAGITISDLRFRLSNDRLLHVLGRIATPGGGLTAGTIVQLLPTGFFASKGVEVNFNAGTSQIANVIYCKDTTSAFKATFSITGQFVVDADVNGFIDLNGYLHIDNYVPA